MGLTDYSFNIFFQFKEGSNASFILYNSSKIYKYSYRNIFLAFPPSYLLAFEVLEIFHHTFQKNKVHPQTEKSARGSRNACFVKQFYCSRACCRTPKEFLQQNSLFLSYNEKLKECCSGITFGWNFPMLIDIGIKATRAYNNVSKIFPSTTIYF